jgi:hypothetical protein
MKYSTCPSKREGVTVCGDFVEAPGQPVDHYEVMPPEEALDD